MTRVASACPPIVLAYDTTVEGGERPHDVVARAVAAGLHVFCTRCGPLARGARAADAEVLAAAHVEHWRQRRLEAKGGPGPSGAQATG